MLRSAVSVLAFAFAVLPLAAHSEDTFKIGIMNDQSGPIRRSLRANRRAGRQDGDRGFRRRSARQEDRAAGRRPPEQGRRRPQHRARMVRREGGRGDLRHHQFRRRARAGRSRQVAPQVRDLRQRLVLRPHRQGLLAQHVPVERRQLVERRLADAAADPAEARHVLFHHRRLRVRRQPRERRARRDREGRRQGAGRRARAAQHRRFLAPTCCRRRPRARKSSCSPTPARISPIRSSRPTNSASARASTSRRRSPISATSTPPA